MDDTADTAECGQAVGGGCAWVTGEVVVPPCGEDSADSGGGDADSGVDTAASTGGAEVRGSGIGGGCALVDAAPLWTVLLVALMVGLRRRLALMLALLLLAPGALAGVEGQRHRPHTGGPWTQLRPADLGENWGFSGSLSASYARNPVVLATASGDQPLLSDVLTMSVGAALRIKGGPQLGLYLPAHYGVVFEGQREGNVRGDAGLWLAIPLNDPEDSETGNHWMWMVQADFPTGDEDVYLGNPSGTVMGVLGYERGLPAGLTGIANLGVRLLTPTTIPGTRWGSQVEYGVGARGNLVSSIQAALEVVGSANQADLRSPASWPLDLYASSEVALPLPNLSLRLGTGGGLTRGVGSPSFRLFASVQYYERDWPDSDGDGIVDPRDACPREAEDMDGWRDGDGCPEPDNDRDGFADAVDRCPDQAEVLNGLDDDDGCPDRAFRLELEVRSTDPDRLQQATVTIDDDPPIQQLAEEPLVMVRPSNLAVVRVDAPGHESFDDDVLLREDQRVVITLVAIYFSTLDLRLQDPQGEPLDGWLLSDDLAIEVPRAGATFEDMPSGTRSLTVGAPGYERRTVDVELPRDGRLEVTVDLEPAKVTLTRHAIGVSEAIHFQLDSDTLEPDSRPMIEAIAELLLANPGIELMRVEGHADERGVSRYNLELSRRRAESVVAQLVELGVDAGRLEAIGTGEGRSSSDESQQRSVEFVVLVWDEGQMPPELEE